MEKKSNHDLIKTCPCLKNKKKYKRLKSKRKTDNLSIFKKQNEVLDMLYCQQEISWNIWDERKFMEELLNTRFNFFLVTYTLFFATLFQLSAPLSRLAVATVAFCLLFLLWIAILRIYEKFIIIAKILFNIPGNTVLHVIKKELRFSSKVFVKGEVLTLVYVYIPMVSLISLFIVILDVLLKLFFLN